MHVLIVFFGLVPFLNTDAVLDHLPESIKVKFVGSHDIKKQLLYYPPSKFLLRKFGSDIANDGI